ncbi:HIT family protein [Chryseotalea sanaruensis]|uniref:HIT family protein n=1 Tax=Chryseotalea sanaruensis TaxID=2482724 RepID=A0A401UEM7_9BACT|nr:HIT family protein [Chryseotalea sanaruensis]GCC53356.1 HIT family protein [Chryseotalea sanaruensis]
MASIFTKIINREIPGYIVAEDERYIAIHDISPLVMGHVLVIPKQESDYIFDLENDALAGLTLFAKKVAIAVKKAIPCKRVGVAVIGLEVPHVHIHLVPMNSMGDINFTKPKLSPSKEELAEVTEKIKAAL